MRSGWPRSLSLLAYVARLWMPWSDDFTLIIGLTPTGRATIETLFLNREGVVNLRQLLYAIGKHPPPLRAE